MDNRIPLDSTLWEKDHWTGVDDPRRALNEIKGAKSPDPEAVVHMIEGTFYVDFPSPHFFYLIPYLLDLFEIHTKSLFAPIDVFCLYIHKAHEGKPEKRWLDQFTTSRTRIAKVLHNAIDLVEANSPHAYDHYKSLLAGLATSYGQSDLGRQIVGLPPDSYIN